MLCSPAGSPKDVGFRCVFLVPFFGISFNMMMTMHVMKKTAKKPTFQDVGYTNLCFKVGEFLCQEGGNGRFSYYAWVSQVEGWSLENLETNMAPPRKIWGNRLVAWRLLLQSFTYVIILYNIHVMYMYIFLWIFISSSCSVACCFSTPMSKFVQSFVSFFLFNFPIFWHLSTDSRTFQRAKILVATKWPGAYISFPRFTNVGFEG